MNAARFAALLLLSTTPLSGQAPGDLDLSFGAGGVARVDVRVGGDPRQNVATDVEVDATGRLLLGGAAGLLPGSSGDGRMVAVRLTAAGALDPSFGPDGRVRVTPFPDMPADYWSGRLALGPAGEIYLHNGVFDGVGAVGWVTAKLNPNGSLAGGFGDGGFVGFLTGDVASPGDVAVQANGRLVERRGSAVALPAT